MLAYHPAFDIYNCIFRVLCLLNAAEEKEISFQKLRIWDFYLAFPGQVKNISFPIEFTKLKNSTFNFTDNPYEQLIDPKLIFEKMLTYQLSAVRCLASYGFLETKSLERNVIKTTDKKYPVEIIAEIENISVIKKDVIKLLVEDFMQLPLYGFKGLKSRTGLIDFKYDPR